MKTNNNTSLFQRDQVMESLKQSFVKLNPKIMVKNPVMFTVEISTLIMFIVTLFSAIKKTKKTFAYNLLVFIILLVTLLFANFAEAIAEAREKGDLSENAEYDAAKEMQGHIEGRIAELEGKIPALQIIDPKTLQAGDRIVFGATVELEDEDGKINVYQIVGDDEADIKQNRISISSPVARSLIGKYEGDEVTCPAPKGLIHYAIVSVKYI